MSIQLWVRVIGTGAAGDHYRPDLPDGMGYAAEIPSHLARSHERYGHPAVQHCRVTVSDTDAVTLRASGKEVADVPEADRLTVELDASCPRVADEPTAAALVARAKSKDTGKVILLRATQLGLAPDRAEALRVKHALPVAAQKDGIDADLHEAAAVHVVRHYKLGIAAARGIVSSCLDAARVEPKEVTSDQ